MEPSGSRGGMASPVRLIGPSHLGHSFMASSTPAFAPSPNPLKAARPGSSRAKPVFRREVMVGWVNDSGDSGLVQLAADFVEQRRRYRVACSLQLLFVFAELYGAGTTR